MSALPLARDPSPAPPAGTFAERLRALRRARGWSQRHLALLAGLYEDTVRKVECGRPPTLATASALLAVLDAPVAALPAAVEAAASMPGRTPSPQTAGLFGALLARYRRRAGLSQNALGRRAGLHSTIVNRYESGERDRPGREAVDALAGALALTEPERDRLLLAAGHAPGYAADRTVRQLAALLATAPAPAVALLRAQIAASYRAMRGEGAAR